MTRSKAGPGERARCRILHVNESAQGGVERYLQRLTAGMDADRFEHVLVCSPDYSEERFRGRLAGFEAVPQMRHAMGPWDIGAILALRRCIRKYRPDIVYAHSSKAGVYARLANLGMGCICVYNPHGWSFNMQVAEPKKAAYAWIERALSPLCDRIICVSNAEKTSALQRRIAREDKLTVIMNGIDVRAAERASGADRARSALGIPGDAFVVGTVGRISAQKAPDVFVRAAGQILADVKDAHFIMVGSGELEGETRALADACGLGGRLHITGWVDNPIDYVALFDVAALLSRWEGLPLVLLEYMAAGKPVVASRAEANMDVVRDGEDGLLVDVDDWRQAAAAVERLRGDAALREKLTANAAERVRREFTLERVIAEHEALFDALTGAGGAGKSEGQGEGS